jgi:hypothetical protein
MEDVLANPTEPWCWRALSQNPNITMQNVLNNLDRPWDWTMLSHNPSITFKDALAWPPKHPHMWLLKFAMKHPTRVFHKYWKRHLTVKWDWDTLIAYPHIAMEVIRAKPDKPWSMYLYNVAAHPDATVKDALAIERYRWPWQTFSRHPNVTIEDVFAHADLPWHWGLLSENLFGHDEHAMSRQMRRTLTFKEELVQCAWHPERFQEWCCHEDI